MIKIVCACLGTCTVRFEECAGSGPVGGHQGAQPSVECPRELSGSCAHNMVETEKRRKDSFAPLRKRMAGLRGRTYVERTSRD